ncbi:MAG: hypothetical protein HY742_03010 [Deltaproteobacteria bacterium]|nr:hypothetical protein [Deltaproteobacteria bacterium]
MGLLTNYKNLIYEHSDKTNDFMYLLMKERNKKGKWTTDDVGKIKNQIKLLSNSVPFLVIFILPLGVLMLPLLAGILDRRKEIRVN